MDELRDKVLAGSPLVGTVLTLPGATAAELLADPFDLVWIDLEHAALGPLDAQEMILGAQASGTFALVRLPANAHALMAAMLDAGADGVVLADVTSADVALAAIDKATHPPAGSRGWGPRRLTLRQRGAGRRPARPSVWVQIESATGVAQIAGILQVPGIDAAVAGTADLSFSLGTPLDTHAPELLAAVQAVRQACRAAGTAFGVAGALDTAPQAMCSGASILVHSTDARLCADAVDRTAAWMRTSLYDQPDGTA